MGLSSVIEFVTSDSKGIEKMAIARVTLDASYPAGGYPLTPALFGLSAFAARGDGQSTIIPKMLSFSGGGADPVMCDVDQSTGALRVYYPTGGAGTVPAALAKPSGTVPTGATAVTSTSAQPGLPIVPGEAQEVATATDLHTIIVDLLAIGH